MYKKPKLMYPITLTPLRQIQRYIIYQNRFNGLTVTKEQMNVHKYIHTYALKPDPPFGLRRSRVKTV